PRLAKGATTALAMALALAMMTPETVRAQDERAGEADAVEAISQTRIAYVITGLSSLDATSRAGLQGLSTFLAAKTALEPGEPAGVD
ncbi:hypothetical protein R0J93_24975, partial [Pseudoalteromonas sp. SIMBA_148]